MASLFSQRPSISMCSPHEQRPSLDIMSPMAVQGTMNLNIEL